MRLRQTEGQAALANRWDLFRLQPYSGSSVSEGADGNCLKTAVRLLKFITGIVTCALVYLGCMCSKASFLLMTSQIRPTKVMPYCNADLQLDQQYLVEVTNAEKVSWIWCLIIACLFPELLTFLRSVRICLFRRTFFDRLTVVDIVVIWSFETLHTIGLALLVFAVIPGLNLVTAIMVTSGVALIPGLFHCGWSGARSFRCNRWIDMLAVVAQAMTLLAAFLMKFDIDNSWALPVSTSLVSFRWWRSFIDTNSKYWIIRRLARTKHNLENPQAFLYCFISVWKMILLFTTSLVCVHFYIMDMSNMFVHLPSVFQPNALNITMLPPVFVTDYYPDYQRQILDVFSGSSDVLMVLLIQIFSSYLAYVCGKFACKIVIQELSFSLPILASTPSLLLAAIYVCNSHNGDTCIFTTMLPNYLFWHCPSNTDFMFYATTADLYLWISWFVSYLWITYHIWEPQCERLAPTQKLFGAPMYCSMLIDQSLSLNRQMESSGTFVKTSDMSQLGRYEMDCNENDVASFGQLTLDVEAEEAAASLHPTADSRTLVAAMPPELSIKKTEADNSVKASDYITRIYACATMWHETKAEMMEMLKSLFRMDHDQSSRRLASMGLDIVSQDYYEFETHIFFDDAFEENEQKASSMQVNSFVKTFVQCVNEAGSYVHQTKIVLRTPKMLTVPYGGRMVYVLPGRTRMYVHLKDKSQIRHKKRWSQCMYMYYLLGYRLMELPVSLERREAQAQSTYILALDGDIDFQPSAVILLVDLMKKNPNLGAACGRIHPVGSGPMVWYQLFEYAIGHWLQKATEHMIGCVMCSPGCFSLFRAKALMDDNVMRRYVTKSEEPLHFVQYDQGEDRWLCTLLLQRGYRVDYSAASDAYTHCPEGFSEFFNQRRRWVPSTIANIFDLLANYKATVSINDNISLPYIWYQCMLMIGTIIGPGTIFLMLVGAFVAAFKISNWMSFGCNLVPIVLYTICCLTCRPNVQLFMSSIMSTMYALVMMAVIVGTALQLGEDGLGSPSSIFLISLSGSFFIAALLHPQEFWCVIPGLIYLLCIPSMYLLLIIYSITNLHVVSWGTREVVTKKSRKQLAEEERVEAPAPQQPSSFFAGLFGGNVFRQILCGNSRPQPEQQQAMSQLLQSIEVLNKKIDMLERSLKRESEGSSGFSSLTQSQELFPASPEAASLTTAGPEVTDSSAESVGDKITDSCVDIVDDKIMALPSAESDDDKITEAAVEPVDDTKDSIDFWIRDLNLPNYRQSVFKLSKSEQNFWQDLIRKYLYPLDADVEQQARIQQGLKELRNKCVFMFSVFNSLFVLIVFMLTLHKDSLYINWPFGAKENVTLTPEGDVLVTKEFLRLEPIGILLVCFFFAIILIQFVAMLFHRLGTLAHILAFTDIGLTASPNQSTTHTKDKTQRLVQHLHRMAREPSNQSPESSAVRELEQSLGRTGNLSSLDPALTNRVIDLFGRKVSESAGHGGSIHEQRGEESANKVTTATTTMTTSFTTEPDRRLTLSESTATCPSLALSSPGPSNAACRFDVLVEKKRLADRMRHFSSS